MPWVWGGHCFELSNGLVTEVFDVSIGDMSKRRRHLEIKFANSPPIAFCNIQVSTNIIVLSIKQLWFAALYIEQKQNKKYLRHPPSGSKMGFQVEGFMFCSGGFWECLLFKTTGQDDATLMCGKIPLTCWTSPLTLHHFPWTARSLFPSIEIEHHWRHLRYEEQSIVYDENAGF